jgi:hypothetical protein
MAKKKLINSPADYEIGRGKPPRSSQFKPGQSGNPGGRKKGSRNFKTIFLEVLDSEIEIVEGGRTRRVPMIKALMLRQVQEGLRGHNRALDSLLDRYERHSADVIEVEEELADEDLQLLKRALGASHKRKGPMGSGEQADNEGRHD